MKSIIKHLKKVIMPENNKKETIKKYYTVYNTETLNIHRTRANFTTKEEAFLAIKKILFNHINTPKELTEEYMSKLLQNTTLNIIATDIPIRFEKTIIKINNNQINLF